MFRSHWHHAGPTAATPFTTFPGLAELPALVKEEPEEQGLGEGLRVLWEFARGKQAWVDGAGGGDWQDIGALRALLFRYQAANTF